MISIRKAMHVVLINIRVETFRLIAILESDLSQNVSDAGQLGIQRIFVENFPVLSG